MKIKYLSILAVAFLMTSCQKENTLVDDSGKSLSDISVSSQFGWKTTREVNFNLSVSDSRFSNKEHVITIYTANPNNGGQLLAKGSAILISPYNVKLALPTTMSQVYVVKTAPDGTKVSGLIAVNTTKVSAAISESGIVSSVAANLAVGKGNNNLSAVNNVNILTKEAAPTIPSNAVSMTSNTNNLSANTAYLAENVNVSGINVNNEGISIYVKGNVTLGISLTRNIAVYVMPGATLTLNANYNGAFTLKNFGTLNGLSNFKLPNGSVFYNQNQNLTFNNGLETEKSSTFTNDGVITFNGDFKNGGSLINNGTIKVSSAEIKLTNQSKATVINNGSIIGLNTKAIVNSQGTVTNNNLIHINTLELNGSGTIYNYCTFKTDNWADLNAEFYNYNYFYVGTYTNLNGSGKVIQTSSSVRKAMFSTGSINNFAGSSNFDGQGSDYSLVKIRTSVGNQINNGGSAFVNKTYVIKPANNTINSNKFSGGAKILDDDENYYIEKTDCNEEGNGIAPAPEKKDTDGDGIIDEEDDYPNDGTKAFNNYSTNYTEGGSTVAFEDSWPLKGDYDLNDIVLTYRYLVVTNAQNKVVEIKADYKLLATGGSFKNGAGIQFNLPAASAKNFKGKTGSYLESGQDSVVVILFEDSRVEQQNWNTKPGETASPIVEYSISFDVENGPSINDFGVSGYNPFIWNNTNGYGRGYETHLMGRKPTNKANKDLFGTGDDNSSSGNTYSTHDNLPWALEIPTAPFKYPKERIAITEAYLKFSQWASSSGSQYPDWYTNKGTNYVNNSLIY